MQTLIFDEADVLLDPLFRAQTLAIWSACTCSTLRVSMWSATIGSNIEELAVQTILARQKKLKISKGDRPPLIRTIIGLKDISLPTISHRLTYTATESGKLLGMRQLLHPSRSTPSSKSEKDRAEPLRPPFLVLPRPSLEHNLCTPNYNMIFLQKPVVLHGSPSSTRRFPRAPVHRSCKTSVRARYGY